MGRGGWGLILCHNISISISILLLVSNVITVSIVSIALV